MLADLSSQHGPGTGALPGWAALGTQTASQEELATPAPSLGGMEPFPGLPQSIPGLPRQQTNIRRKTCLLIFTELWRVAGYHPSSLHQIYSVWDPDASVWASAAAGRHFQLHFPGSGSPAQWFEPSEICQGMG